MGQSFKNTKANRNYKYSKKLELMVLIRVKVFAVSLPIRRI